MHIQNIDIEEVDIVYVDIVCFKLAKSWYAWTLSQ